MSGLLLSSDNVYGLVNPPPDPVNDLPELHQTIGSAAVRWDYFVDLSNNIGDRLIAGENVTIRGTLYPFRFPAAQVVRVRQQIVLVQPFPAQQRSYPGHN